METIPTPDQIDTMRFATAAGIGYGEVDTSISAHSTALAGTLLNTRHVLVTPQHGKSDTALILKDTGTKLKFLETDSPILQIGLDQESEAAPDVITRSNRELREFAATHGGSGIVLVNLDPLLQSDQSEVATASRARRNIMSFLSYILKQPSGDRRMPQLCLGSDQPMPGSKNTPEIARPLVQHFEDSVEPTETRIYNFVGETIEGSSTSIGGIALGVASSKELSEPNAVRSSGRVRFYEVSDQRRSQTRLSRASHMAMAVAMMLPGANW